MLTTEYGRPKSASGRKALILAFSFLWFATTGRHSGGTAFSSRACRDGTGFLQQRHAIPGLTVLPTSDRQRRSENGVRLRVGYDLAGLRPCAARVVNHDETEANEEGSQA
jgi:hypothetical protein